MQNGVSTKEQAFSKARSMFGYYEARAWSSDHEGKELYFVGHRRDGEWVVLAWGGSWDDAFQRVRKKIRLMKRLAKKRRNSGAVRTLAQMTPDERDHMQRLYSGAAPTTPRLPPATQPRDHWLEARGRAGRAAEISRRQMASRNR